MGRKLWIVGLLAAVLFFVSSLTGYPVEGEIGTPLRLHLLVALGAALLAFFCHAALVLYLGLTGRLLATTFRERELATLRVRWADVRRRSRIALPLAVFAFSGAVASVLLGGGTYTGSVATPLHHGLAWTALAAQAAALAVEWPLLGRHERLIRGVDAELGEMG